MTAEVIYGVVFGKPKAGNELDRLVDDVLREYPQTMKYLQAMEYLELPSDTEPPNEPA